MKTLYDGEADKVFSTLFAHPGSLYRDIAFWAWNSRLDEKELYRQIAIFKEMGMGGFFMHARTGLSTEYLGPEFMHAVRTCVEVAKREGLSAWLYDEDRYPAGAAGGLVTRHVRYRTRYLLLTRKKRAELPERDNDDSGKLIAFYGVSLDRNNMLLSYRRVEETEILCEKEIPLYVYRMVGRPDGWYNYQTSIDVYNPEAVRYFLNVTYETYFREVGSEFGRTIPAVFSDEPRPEPKFELAFADDEHGVVQLPYTDDLPQSYFERYGEDFFSALPELVWESANRQFSRARYRYCEHLGTRFEQAYFQQIGKWCKEHNLFFTGHMLAEGELDCQCVRTGDVMRCFKSFGLPGIDMLCDFPEYGTAKQAQSVSRQYGCGGVLSELDGVTDWDFDFKGHKGHGDWQAALGVTVRVPHLSHLSLKGEAKRDYPASISFQSAWWKKYPLIANHFARVNVAMTRGKACVHIGVIHPIESYFLVLGPRNQTHARRELLESGFQLLTKWLLHGLIDFDFISEALLPDQNPDVEGSSFRVGEMAYEIVIVPPCFTLRSSTLALLERFRDQGGGVLFAGHVPECCEAERSSRAEELAARSEHIDFQKETILEALQEQREITVLSPAGKPLEELVCQLREEDVSTRYLFIANTRRIGNSERAIVRIRGEWQVEMLDTFQGTIRQIDATCKQGWTEFRFVFHPHGHLLVRLSRAEQSIKLENKNEFWSDVALETDTLFRLEGEHAVTLDEPNVLVLDMPRWRISPESAWHEREEILRIDDLVRAQLGLPLRRDRAAQPWVDGIAEGTDAVLELAYEVENLVPVGKVRLGMENPERAECFLDGCRQSLRFDAWWLDPAIRTAEFPDLVPGKHEIIIKIAFNRSTDLEKVYLLGDFGVEVRGDKARLISPVSSLCWGNAAAMGLPFYGGKLTYHIRFVLEKSMPLRLHLPSRITDMPNVGNDILSCKELPLGAYRGVTAGIILDGKIFRDLAFAPYECELGTLEAGEHRLDIELYGSRINCAGSLHLNFRIPWSGPASFRPQGDLFGHEYHIVPFGIFCAPKLLRGRTD